MIQKQYHSSLLFLIGTFSPTTGYKFHQFISIFKPIFYTLTCITKESFLYISVMLTIFKQQFVFTRGTSSTVVVKVLRQCPSNFCKCGIKPFWARLQYFLDKSQGPYLKTGGLDPPNSPLNIPLFCTTKILLKCKYSLITIYSLHSLITVYSAKLLSL